MKKREETKRKRKKDKIIQKKAVARKWTNVANTGNKQEGCMKKASVKEKENK
jgi:hypothetical protein